MLQSFSGPGCNLLYLSNPVQLSVRNIQPKISDFGAVDDEGKRSISLWHKQTPGIPGVDFYLERLYNILQP